MYSRILLFALFISMPVSGNESESPQIVDDKAKDFHPEYSISYYDSMPGPNETYNFSRYVYKDDGGNIQGIAYILWNKQTSNTLWGLDWMGDFTPHSISWQDFNGDGKRDLFFFAGFEDVFETYLYVWNVKDENYNRENLLKAYENKNNYSVVLDFEGDGNPEILDSGHIGDEHFENQCIQNEYSYAVVPTQIEVELTKKYMELSGKFDHLNFTYNLPKHYPIFSMSILSPIKIIRIQGDSAVDVTSEYPNHLRWRLEQLGRIRPENTGKCRDLVDSVITYIQGRLDESK